MRTLTIVRIATSLGALACTLACAGIWRDVHRESFSEMSIRLADLPGLEPTRRAEAQALLEDGWIAAHEGRMDFSTAVMFDVAFDEALEDGALSGLDIEVLREASSTFVSPELTPERRAELVAYLAEMDAEQRRALGLAAPPAHQEPVEAGDAPLDRWRLPSDLKDKLGALGWSGVSCTDDETPTPRFAECDGYAGTQVVRVTIERDPEQPYEEGDEGIVVRQSGRTWLTVGLKDGRAAEVLRDAVLPASQRLNALTTATLSTSLERQGMTVRSCSSEDGRFLSCDAARDASRATVLVDLSPETDPASPSTRATAEGIASLTQGEDQLTVCVLDAAAASAVVDGLLR